MNIVSLTTICLFGITLTAVLHSGFGFSMTYYDMKTLMEQRRHDDMWSYLKENAKRTGAKWPPKEYPDLYLTQRLDHFDAQVEATYNQRYWVNADFWTDHAGPVFLFIGGEGGSRSSDVQPGMWAITEFAQQYGALVFSVEHRFYGKSMNEDGWKLENLRYLSSAQALADLGYFHAVMTKKYNLTSANKWIAFGGSYPGNLAAWFRIKYPHLVTAAVASSAPVRAKVAVYEFMDVIAKAYANTDVKGSPNCSQAIHQAFQTVDYMSSSGQRQKLATDFNACDLSTDEEMTHFAYNIMGFFWSAAQYYSSEIAPTCNIMLNPKTPYENLVHLLNNQMPRQQPCKNCTWENYVELLEGPKTWVRQWVYQTCAEFGYYTTCDNKSECEFSRHLNVGMDLYACEALFNIPSPEVYDRVDFTNTYYGSDTPAGSRIIFVNGLLDPWHALGVLTNISDTQRAILIPDVTHCADMFASRPSDSPALKAAHEEINYQIGKWLKMANTVD